MKKMDKADIAKVVIKVSSLTAAFGAGMVATSVGRKAKPDKLSLPGQVAFGVGLMAISSYVGKKAGDYVEDELTDLVEEFDII